MILWHMSVIEFNIKQHFTSPYTPISNGKTENIIKFLKASIRKLCQEDNSAWDQVLDQIPIHMPNVALTPQLVKHHILCSISETHPYQFTN